ncbi:MAG: hypothetical protein M1828_003938 [Chrysothrix sp. TS-e1954]|nr:MAG: hypothetical protein M1828_003938 [Chrysothrix sp. TS-e1954]
MSVFHRTRGQRKAGDCAAIFVHAGAGYHSVQNEQTHLQACNDAAMAAMTLLRNGGSAVDAVEIAIKILEDREITNAGYGSNLAIDGVVEGDAVVVDHFGRSGGVGAVAQIKNPISLARIVLRLSTQELTLRRVPPNLLVGQGATDFAFDQGMPVLPPDALVSPSAKDRWQRWKQDLKNAEKKAQHRNARRTLTQEQPDPPPTYDEQVQSQAKREHTQAVRAAVWNEGQPTSPSSSPLGVRRTSGVSTGSRASSADSRTTPATPNSQASDAEVVAPLTAENLAQNMRHRDEVAPSTQGSYGRPIDPQDAASDPQAMQGIERSHLPSTLSEIDDSEQPIIYTEGVNEYYNATGHDGHSMSDEEESSNGTLRLPSLTPTPPSPAVGNVPLPQSPPPRLGELHVSTPLEHVHDPSPLPPQPVVFCGPALPPKSPKSLESTQCLTGEDDITDTVGAIAIDNDGNLASGASSGGIGMKFRGRIGPAALVGVGAAVCPLDVEDRSRTCTAAVTSGTGEHMGTTLAANICSERLYHGQRKRKGGGVESCEDDQAVRAMIEQDFMGHPSVKNSHSTGAIGVLAVKKTAHGAYLYFAHNTDSFALASMSADEPKPTCTMSRSHGNGMVAQGGRAIRYKRRW